MTVRVGGESRRTQRATGLEELTRHMKREAELGARLCLSGIAAEQQTSRLGRRLIYTAASLTCALLGLNTQRNGLSGW